MHGTGAATRAGRRFAPRMQCKCFLASSASEPVQPCCGAWRVCQPLRFCVFTKSNAGALALPFEGQGLSIISPPDRDIRPGMSFSLSSQRNLMPPSVQTKFNCRDLSGSFPGGVARLDRITSSIISGGTRSRMMTRSTCTGSGPSSSRKSSLSEAYSVHSNSTHSGSCRPSGAALSVFPPLSQSLLRPSPPGPGTRFPLGKRPPMQTTTIPSFSDAKCSTIPGPSPPSTQPARSMPMHPAKSALITVRLIRGSITRLRTGWNSPLAVPTWKVKAFRLHRHRIAMCIPVPLSLTRAANGT